MNLQHIVSFSQFLYSFRQIERNFWLSQDQRHESDAEHTYTLAMMARYVIQSYKFPLSIDKAIRYVLVHDLVEIYAGDVDAFTNDVHQKSIKEQKEHEALEKMKTLWADFPEMLDAIDMYENKTDAEAVFVYALDKLLPAILIYGDDGYLWKKKGVTYNAFRMYKDAKIQICPYVTSIYDDLMKRIEIEGKQHYFPYEIDTKTD